MSQGSICSTGANQTADSCRQHITLILNAVCANVRIQYIVDFFVIECRCVLHTGFDLHGARLCHGRHGICSLLEHSGNVSCNQCVDCCVVGVNDDHVSHFCLTCVCSFSVCCSAYCRVCTGSKGFLCNICQSAVSWSFLCSFHVLAVCKCGHNSVNLCFSGCKGYFFKGFCSLIDGCLFCCFIIQGSLYGNGKCSVSRIKCCKHNSINSSAGCGIFQSNCCRCSASSNTYHNALLHASGHKCCDSIISGTCTDNVGNISALVDRNRCV